MPELLGRAAGAAAAVDVDDGGQGAGPVVWEEEVHWPLLAIGVLGVDDAGSEIYGLWCDEGRLVDVGGLAVGERGQGGRWLSGVHGQSGGRRRRRSPSAAATSGRKTATRDERSKRRRRWRRAIART